MSDKFIVFAEIGEVIPLNSIGKFISSVDVKYSYELNTPNKPDDIFRLVRKGEAVISLSFLPKDIVKGKKEEDSDYATVFRRIPINIPSSAVPFLDSDEFKALEDDVKAFVVKRTKRIMAIVKKKASYDYAESLEANRTLVTDNAGMPALPVAGISQVRKEDFQITDEEIAKYQAALKKLKSIVEEIKTDTYEYSIKDFKKMLRKTAGQSEVVAFQEVLRSAMLEISDSVFG